MDTETSSSMQLLSNGAEASFAAEAVEQDLTLSDQDWKDYYSLALEVSVRIPLPEMRLVNLARIAPGSLLQSSWLTTSDVPLYIDQLFLASVSFEPDEGALGVRINDFVYRHSRHMAQTIINGLRDVEDVSLPGMNLLREVKVSPYLCVGRKRLLLRDVLQWAPGYLMSLDRALEDQVSFVVKGRCIAQGRLVSTAGCYAVEIASVGEVC